MAATQDLRHVAGTMTGTSIDGLDAALVAVRGRGLAMQCRVVRHRAFEFPADLASRLRSAAEQAPLSAGAFARLALEFGRFHAECLVTLLASERADLVVVHGQTVFHAPPVSWQLVETAPIAERLGTTVVSNLRQVDLAAGGEGAPITPLADWVLFRAAHSRAVVNLGGFCNATLLPAGTGPDAVRGFDACACNQVLDAVARRALHEPYDRDGQAALRGTPDPDLRAELGDLLLAQRAARRSLGTGDELGAWVERAAARLAPSDTAATAAEAVGLAIGSLLREEGIESDGDILLAGGGARHQRVSRAIGEAARCTVRALDDVGVPIEVREAAEMAVLGALAEDGVDITLPAVTGRGPTRSRAGSWVRPVH